MRALGFGLVIMALVVSACRTPVDATTADGAGEASMANWTIRVGTEGGITGRGDGSIEADSDGTVERTTATGDVCRATASTADLERLASAVRAADPEAWDEEYVDPRGADMFTYELSLGDGARDRIVRWNDGGDIPADLRALWDALLAIRNAVHCTPTH